MNGANEMREIINTSVQRSLAKYPNTHCTVDEVVQTSTHFVFSPLIANLVAFHVVVLVVVVAHPVAMALTRPRRTILLLIELFFFFTRNNKHFSHLLLINLLSIYVPV